jgi:Ca2+/Na+ antiporter
MNEYFVLFLIFFLIAYVLLIDTKIQRLKDVLLLSASVLIAKYIYSSKKVENMTSEEAIKNIASVYNTDNMVVKNLKVTGDLTVDGNAKINGHTSVYTLAGDLRHSPYASSKDFKDFQVAYYYRLGGSQIGAPLAWHEYTSSNNGKTIDWKQSGTNVGLTRRE